MAFAQIYQSTTNVGTTSVTMFGTYGNWKELPDCFPPILWIDSTSPAGKNQGLYLEGKSSATNAYTLYMRVQVANYEPGTKWFMTNVGLESEGLSLYGAVLEAPSTASGLRKVNLYYRAVGEGPDPNRML